MKNNFTIIIILLLGYTSGAQETERFFKNSIEEEEIIGKRREDESESEFSLHTLPAMLTPITSARIVPSLKLSVAQSTINRQDSLFSGWAHNLGVYIAKEPSLSLESGSFTKTGEDLSRDLWIPEASSFFFDYSISYLRRPKSLNRNGIAVGLTFYYLNKQIPGKSSTSTVFDEVKTVGLALFQFNARYIFWNKEGNVFSSVYANFNNQIGFDNVKSYKEYYGINKNVLNNYLDLGFEVALGGKDESDIFLDIGFVVQSKEVRRVTNNNDLVIPVIKLKANPRFK
ncbi:MAG: hypothetical protein JXR03_11060 [Cyclobacteriaceae bacterium]